MFCAGSRHFLGGVGLGLGISESTLAAFTMRSLHYSELHVGVPLSFLFCFRGYPLNFENLGVWSD